MNEESHDPATDVELEARIVALVLGEASDFERDEIERLIQQRPELAALKKQIQLVHGLMQEIGTGELAGDNDIWQLSPDNRNTLLASISGEVVGREHKQATNKAEKHHKAAASHSIWNWTRIAAAFCFVVGAGSLAFVSIRSAMEAPRSRQLALYEGRESESATDQVWDADPKSDGSYFRNDAAIASADDALLSESELAVDEGLGDDGNRARSALEAIRARAGGDLGTSSLPPQADSRRATAAGETNWSDEQGQETMAGLALLDSKGNAPKPGSAQLSLPKLPASPEHFIRPSVPAISESLSRDQAQLQSDFLSDATNASVAAGRRAGSKISDELSSGVNGPIDAIEQTVQAPTSGLPSNDGEEAGAYRYRLADQQRAAGEQFGGRGYGSPEGEAQNGGFGGGGGGFASGGSRMGERNGWFGNDLARKRESVDKFAFEKQRADESGRYGAFSRHAASPLEHRHAASPREPSIAGAPTTRMGDKESAKQSSQRGAGAMTFSNLESPELKGMNMRPDPAEGDQSAKDAANLGGWQYNGETDQPTGQTVEPELFSGSRDDHELKERMLKSLNEVSDLSDFEVDSDGLGRLSDGRNLNQRGATWSLDGGSAGKQQNAVLPHQTQSTVRGRRPSASTVSPRGEERFDSRSKALAKTPVPVGLQEQSAEDESFSTFSLHVSDVSFKLAGGALSQGEWPDAARIRIEEFINAFDYGDPLPGPNDKVACFLEQSIHPFLQQRNLMRVAIRTAASGRANDTPLRLTLLLDNSGSMERPDRYQTVRRAFALLAQQLKPIDQVTLIGFARQPRLLADKVSGTQAGQLVELIDRLPSEGGTNIEAALQLAFEKAQEQQLDEAQNRIVLLTDGAVNLGDANAERLARMVTMMRDAGVAFDAAGISAEGLNDEVLEALTRRGDGRYYLLDSAEAADDGFARQIAGALRPSAKNVKVQVEFNPKRVGRYKLLGFEKHRLEKEDFRNDKVDAAEMAAAEAGVAVYQFEVKPNGVGDVGFVSVRFRDLSTGQMIEQSWPIPYDANVPRLDQAAASLRIATSAALLAAKFRGEQLGELVDLKLLSEMIAELPERDRGNRRIQQLQLMIQQARQIGGN